MKFLIKWRCFIQHMGDLLPVRPALQPATSLAGDYPVPAAVRARDDPLPEPQRQWWLSPLLSPGRLLGDSGTAMGGQPVQATATIQAAAPGELARRVQHQQLLEAAGDRWHYDAAVCDTVVDAAAPGGREGEARRRWCAAAISCPTACGLRLA